MSLDPSSAPSVQEFNTHNLAQLSRQELGVKGFSEIMPNLAEIKSMIDEVIPIYEQMEHKPSGLINQVLAVINRFNEFAKEIKSYNIDQDPNFQVRNRIISQIRQWYGYIYQGADDNRNPIGFLTAYNSFKIQNLLALQKDRGEIEELKKVLQESNSEALKLINVLKSRATSETVHDYALIFENQASKHSLWKISVRPFTLHVGNAERWLAAACVAAGACFVAILKLRHIIPIDANSASATLTVTLVTRFVLITFVIYLTTFCFKQYSVHKHLHTLNQHRKNTLNSFNLFIKSLDASDVVTRNALMLEVAKAIYESGHSGYISTKESSESSPSVIEMTRYLNK